MTRELVAAMDEYLEAANSLERWDLSAGEASPVLDALRIAHRNLLNELEAFEATVGGQGTALGPKATADLVALSG